MSGKITPEQQALGAVVYVRQSSMTQLRENNESRRRQYDLTAYATELGFARVAVIDDDLGRSASGTLERPGFRRLVGDVCAGTVGAVLCIEASRLARNGRDWHHLIDLCALAGVLVIDPDGVYDPRLVNDRLLLGMKGTMSEFELTLLRQRSRGAIEAKARRGELQFRLVVGLHWTEDGRIELDPDVRVQQALRMVFRKFTELGSVRQVMMWLREEGLTLPMIASTPAHTTVWVAPIYRRVLAIIRNPFYAGAYAFGQSAAQTRIEDGRAHRSYGHPRPVKDWTVLIRDHHQGYIGWAEFEQNQLKLAENAHMHPTESRKSGRGGSTLLAGLLRCARCGRMLHVVYQRRGHARYECRYENRTEGAPRCISFSNLDVDERIAREVVGAVQPLAIEAAMAAASSTSSERFEQRRALELELEAARYQCELAARRYEAVDPSQRLVAGELERRWNVALARQGEVEARLRAMEDAQPPVVDRGALMSLAASLESVWEMTANAALKQRIVRLLIEEIVVDILAASNELSLVVHWSGGRHSELRLPRRKAGDHRHRTAPDAESVVRAMAGGWPDKDIAATLNRLRLRTGVGNTWTESRVSTLRRRLELPAHDPSAVPSGVCLSLNEAADRLGVGPWVVRRLIKLGLLDASQVVPSAPWQIRALLLDQEVVRQGARDIVARRRRPRSANQEDQSLVISGT